MKKMNILALVILSGSLAFGQKAITKSDSIEMTAEITAIDHDGRMVTLEDDDGNVESLYAGPEIKRFNELKVGDKVTIQAIGSPDEKKDQK